MRSVVSSISHSVRIARFNTEVKAMCGSSFSLCSSRPASMASCAAQIAQIDIVPAGEQILDIPSALSVTDQDQFSRHDDSSYRIGRGEHAVEASRQRLPVDVCRRAGECVRGRHARSILRNFSTARAAGAVESRAQLAPRTGAR